MLPFYDSNNWFSGSPLGHLQAETDLQSSKSFLRSFGDESYGPFALFGATLRTRRLGERGDNFPLGGVFVRGHIRFCACLFFPLLFYLLSQSFPPSCRLSVLFNILCVDSSVINFFFRQWGEGWGIDAGLIIPENFMTLKGNNTVESLPLFIFCGERSR